MLIVHVHVHVKPESVADFRQVTLENARSSDGGKRPRHHCPCPAVHCSANHSGHR
jgi:hypothetical protein